MDEGVTRTDAELHDWLLAHGADADAARLVDAAIPGEALVDRSVVEALKDDDLGFEPAGRRMLKGFDEPVAVWSLTPRD